MRKNTFISLLAVAAIGIGAWAAILAAVGNGGVDSVGGGTNPVQDTASGKSAEASQAQDTASDSGAGRGQVQVSAPASTEEASWGLSFQEEGRAPIGNATPAKLAQYGAYYIDEAGAAKKKIYLTFDVGYENGNTAAILDVLKEEEVTAAFFVVGNFVEDEPELVRRMEAEGCVVGNHTMTHPDMAAIRDEEAFRNELTALENAYREATGKEMKKFYRPPQGRYSEENLRQAHALGYTTVFWSLAYVDWYENEQPTREDALNLLNRRIHPGAIVLLHSTSKTNAKILAELIRGWKAEGYEFCSLEELQ